MKNAVHWTSRLAITPLIILATTLYAGDVINTSPNSGLAIHGYDPVAYFINAEPRKGDDNWLYDHQGVTWRFSNEANKQAFVKSPEKYIPQYGGHCAFAASKNAIADVDPTAWSIHQDKLYLNYSYQVRQVWTADRDSSIRKADRYWPELAKQIK